MKIKEVVKLKQALVRWGNFDGYAERTVGVSNVKEINFHPKLQLVETIKENGKVNFYQDFSGLFGEETLQDTFVVIGIAGNDPKFVKTFNDIDCANDFCKRKLENEVNTYIEENDLTKEDVSELEYGYVEGDHYDFFNPQQNMTMSYKIMKGE